MALIACPDCSREVSDKAPSCPHCGTPIASAQEHQQVGVPLMTVQETSKRLKGHILIAAVLFWGGILWMFTGGTEAAPLATLSITAGFFWWVATRFRIWWHHK